ncbi:hypothetical protein NUU61_008231 [Penicillium alfredii]|uniref:Uncharacterized protein n=1 Tax=Penicillium alfredii TaxID=1506179 RepID=A0A9W9JYU2_9EURO|nr:uncharacterized protein NUU61_008231 [Penicillium alfredii]KAJ5086924.1 hypothetical protein NUU61_008231 [Penicillium alfredii]
MQFLATALLLASSLLGVVQSSVTVKTKDDGQCYLHLDILGCDTDTDVLGHTQPSGSSHCWFPSSKWSYCDLDGELDQPQGSPFATLKVTPKGGSETTCALDAHENVSSCDI